MNQAITPHEKNQLHELLTFKNTSLTKSVTMAPLISDAELKGILQQDMNSSKEHIKELIAFIEKV